MLAWIVKNWVTIAVIAVLLIIVGLAVFSLVRARKKKRVGCTGNCATCGGCCCNK